jgi:hypothetical protein
MQNGFGVALRLEVVPVSNEVPPQIAIVVDLTVENNRDQSRFVGDGLVTSCQVDDAEAAHPHANISISGDSLIIGPSMLYRIAHRGYQAAWNREVTVTMSEADDSAH